MEDEGDIWWHSDRLSGEEWIEMESTEEIIQLGRKVCICFMVSLIPAVNEKGVRDTFSAKFINVLP
ncbi:MAG: hypothetical protein HDR13_00370 [Lachnospiraceae bacterium]|nr:hypothetical protein [Lachnospiraceae bacterium]